MDPTRTDSGRQLVQTSRLLTTNAANASPSSGGGLFLYYIFESFVQNFTVTMCWVLELQDASKNSVINVEPGF